MGEAFLDYKKGGSGLNINGIIEDYYVYAGENVSAGDFVEFINGIAESKTETSSNTPISENTHHGLYISACELPDNKVFIAHSTGGSTNTAFLHGMVCTINGATITCGTSTKLTSKAYVSRLSATTLENVNVFIAYSSGSSSENLYAVACTIDGMTITAGENVTIKNDTKVGYYISAEFLTNGKVFVAHNYGNSYYLYGVVCTVSGTTITVGTDTSLVNSSNAGDAKIAELSSDKVFIAHKYGSNSHLYGIVCTISGTTISKGTDKALKTTTGSAYGMSLAKMSSSKVFISHGYGSYQLYAMVCTVSGTTITAGTDTALIQTDGTCKNTSTILLKNGQICICHTDPNIDYSLDGLICSVSGTTITRYIVHTLSGEEGSAYAMSPVVLENGNVFIAHSYTKDNRYLYANLYAVNPINTSDGTYDILNRIIKTTTYETQVRPATSLPCNGVASTSGVGGDSTGHKDIVSVYLPKINLVANGDFSNGLDGWYERVGGSSSTGYSSFEVIKENGENVLKVIITAASTNNIISHPLSAGNCDTTHSYYVKGYVKGVSTNVKGTGSNAIVINSITNTVSVQETEFTLVSKILTGQQASIVSLYNAGVVGNVYYWKDISVYDLTALYGAGKEPTKEWCDANL